MSVASLRRAATESVAGLPRTFWWLWTSTLVNRLGGFVLTFLALYLTAARGFSAAYAGLVASLIGAGGVIASMLGGVLADRLGRRPTLLGAQLATAATVAVLAFVRDPVSIAVTGFALGLASNASRPAIQAMMADIVPDHDRVRAFSLNYWAINLGFAISSVYAGFLVAQSYTLGFLVEAGMTLACALVVFVKVKESRPEPGPKSVTEQPVTMGTVLRDGRFMLMVGLSFLVAVVFTQSSVGLPIVMGQNGLSSSDVGLVASVNGIVIVALQIPLTRFIQRRDPGRLLAVSSLLIGYGFALTAVAGSLGAYALTVVVWTLGEMVNAPTQSGLVARLAPAAGRGRYQGMYTLSWSAAALVAPLAGGWVIDSAGANWLWTGCAALGTVTAFGYWALMRGLPTQEVTTVPAAAAPVVAVAENAPA
ncbi:MFS transporter [Streptomyces sp. VRA16 Mangrove soil]|uniref:MDR family MFS transporter n=1 Tax=Streptomyces sp. VRA16 Mangrove soil TaxID=2817434 RepID=UPI001A9FF47B|nr:MFS transporter [Streptomyces sp. VRA16 Mangrove soil]MBO1337462.1 MFS transporter [Streptomyces sp. VRA16 Mangrove soil]